MDATSSPEEPPHVPASDTIDNAETTSRPTHSLERINVGNRGVQLLVSTRDHLYNANGVEAGEDSWQVVGAWDDNSVHELTQILSQRQVQSNSPSPGPRPTRFGSSYGAGQTLGGASQGNGNARE